MVGSQWRTRRLQRRLRRRLRHERLSVAMALAEPQHHAPRGQRMAWAGGVEREVKYEPRLLDPPLPQVAATLGHVAAGVPLLVVPSLRVCGADGVDGTAASFLVKAAIGHMENEVEEEKVRKAKQKEEEEEEEVKSLLAVPFLWRSPASRRSRTPRGKRGRRRGRKKLPQTSSISRGRKGKKMRRRTRRGSTTFLWTCCTSSSSSLSSTSCRCLRFSSLTECWTFQLRRRDRYAQCQPVQNTGDSTAGVLERGC